MYDFSGFKKTIYHNSLKNVPLERLFFDAGGCGLGLKKLSEDSLLAIAEGA